VFWFGWFGAGLSETERKGGNGENWSSKFDLKFNLPNMTKDASATDANLLYVRREVGRDGGAAPHSVFSVCSSFIPTRSRSELRLADLK
jgi:hypothetical protein